MRIIISNKSSIKITKLIIMIIMMRTLVLPNEVSVV